LQVSDAINERRSCRDFDPRPVPKDILQRLMTLACRAPSALNLQPWQFTVVLNQEVVRLGKKLLTAHAERGLGCQPDNIRPLPEVYIERQKELSLGLKPFLQKAGVQMAEFINRGSLTFYGAPAVVVATLHQRVFPDLRAFDVGLCVGWLLLAACELGLATCPIGLICFYEDLVRDFLNIDEARRVLLAVAVGYARKDSPLNRFRSPRAELGQVVRWY
jgi:nitroreductase